MFQLEMQRTSNWECLTNPFLALAVELDGFREYCLPSSPFSALTHRHTFLLLPLLGFVFSLFSYGCAFTLQPFAWICVPTDVVLLSNSLLWEVL
jgi:hypothetical protein